ncbi:MAG: DUF499 domain-containing protein [Chloroflexi bacterium]|nr:DUF499 domain-containing protein [Chloroflexota bacterium]
MDPWYRVVTLREEVREGRSFSPDEFAIALEQVVAGTAPADYTDPAQFFARTYFTRALTEHAGMVLRRLSGETANTAPVLTLITQFGGGKTHTLTSLYHLANAGRDAAQLPGVAELLLKAGLAEAPAARVGVFVGNAWDPADGRETPWIDLARQVAGEPGVAALGPAASDTPPGTEALSRVFAAAQGPVLLLFDEVLNFINRHQRMADSFHAFIQNLTVAVTGTPFAAAVISLPRSQVEMTDRDLQWQERITKVVRRVAQDLIANDESEISEVVRRRLFEDLGTERKRKRVAKAYADWCHERAPLLPREWTAVDTAATEAKGREFLQRRFEACYPFHPATLSVFQRKWRALSQFQQTRGALAMLAQWVSWASRDQFRAARNEPLITLGSAPLDHPEFRGVLLGQLGESRLEAAITTDLAGEAPRSAALDADAKGALRDIHRRVGTAILFESSGGQTDRSAHLPELRFALGEPEVDTTTVDSAATALEGFGFFVRKTGADGYRIHHQPTLRKVVSDRRASLDEETEVRPAIRRLVEAEFGKGAPVPLTCFPEDGSAAPDSPRLTLVVADPAWEWRGGDDIAERVASWTRERGSSPRLYPASLVWCVRKPGRELRESVELSLAWQRVASEIAQGALGEDIAEADRADVRTRTQDADEAVRDEVWGGYRYVVVSDSSSENGLKVIDLGAGHASAGESLGGRVIGALKSQGLLNETIGEGYIERHWPPAFREAGAWPLVSLRQSFLDGSLTRLLDPDEVIRRQIGSWVESGAFGLASEGPEGREFGRVWFGESVGREEIAFESGVFLLTRERATQLREGPGPTPESPEPLDLDPQGPDRTPDAGKQIEFDPETLPARRATLRITGAIPPETWNRFGRSVLPKLQAGEGLQVNVDLRVSADASVAGNIQADVSRAVEELTLGDHLRVEREDTPDGA